MSISATSYHADNRRKELDPERLPHVGCDHCAESLMNEVDFARRLASLSKAQLEILALTARGYLNKEIAWFRGSTEGTIKTHQQAILRRLGLRTRTHAAVQYAIHCDRVRNGRD